ncbi:MAG: phosphotransferase [Alphaproteobacteria bacterium]|nr:phosphotransferase [Alphaproteobacteria bacterium]
MTEELKTQIADAVGRQPVSLQELHGGNVARVHLAEMETGSPLVIKTGGGDFAVEALMLRYLAENTSLPVPVVHHADKTLLIMDWIESGDPIDDDAERDAARHLSALHKITATDFGFECDTLIGPLRQPNPKTSSWLEFFRDHRLLFMARQALTEDRVSSDTMGRFEALASRLDEWIEEPAAPQLLHGDMWGGNVLVKDSRITSFIDPAIYFGNAEMDLAFATLFGTFREPFFETYEDYAPLRPGFWEARRDLYNLNPLLVHLRLFGGDYGRSIDAILNRFGV